MITTVTAKEDLLEAARRLESDGRTPFSPADLIAAAREAGSAYPDQTLRSILISHLSAPAGDPRTGTARPFVRVGRAQYRLTDETGETTGGARETTSPPSPVAMEDGAPSPDTQWSWEGNVQASLVRTLAAKGWSILRVADTASREQGHDIVAERAGIQLLVEVKGWPSTHYARGAKQGEAKTYNQATQGRAYFSNALLSGLLMRADNPDAHVVLAFPAVTTFENLARRVGPTLRKVNIELWLVHEDGHVTVQR